MKLEKSIINNNIKITRDELNEQLLNKQIKDFYVVAFERRKVPLTNAEFADLKKDYNVNGNHSDQEFKKQLEIVSKDENFEQIYRSVLGLFAQIRYRGVVTLIGDYLYDIVNAEFVDLKRNQIIHYENLSEYYNDTSARIIMVDPTEYPILKSPLAVLDIDNSEPLEDYEKTTLQNVKSNDLTKELMNEFIKQNKTRKRTLN